MGRLEHIGADHEDRLRALEDQPLEDRLRVLETRQVYAMGAIGVVLVLIPVLLHFT